MVKSKKVKSVCMIKDDKVLKVFASLSDAARHIGKRNHCVCHAAAFGHRSGGYYWKYLEEGVDLEGEEWKDHPEYPLRCSTAGRIEKDGIKSFGSRCSVKYPFRKVHMDKKFRTYRTVHDLVAETFIPNPENKTKVKHVDGDLNNNAISNLYWE